MGGYTVSEVAKLSGVSVRTLHHYDDIGLLKPADVGANGYRYYGKDELLRLQQILFHRELGFPLDEIGRVLDAPDFDRVAALTAHRTRLQAQARRTRRLVRTIDDTLAALQGATTMDDKAMYRGFDPEKQAKQEAWLVDRYGPEIRKSIDAVKTVQKDWKQADFDAAQAEIAGIEAGFVCALADGLPADSAPVQALTGRHRDWIANQWPQPVTRAAYKNLAALYGEHPDFHARYEAQAAGMTEYLQAAMLAFAERELT
ncbi:MAG: MerR family transcriptional regulator [Phenylobacterium sp.]|uniref:MerR family transcriptional regulator n=1 Tax=Phenylobacterium sp. TaxID=1871053 RepID=UPI0011F99EF1|nr:MerR family transcriptional regulator [Phenylobacterium sp.]TAJ68453.1 MAG: MerR family transcriptional regulator [Phenylobacterium sp.]